MAAGTSSPDSPQTLPKPSGLATQFIEYDRYIENELLRTRRQVKSVDIVSSCMLLAVAALVYLMLLALADHWLVTGGLGRTARITAFGVLAAGTAAFAVLRLAPLVMRRVNPVYAAYTIERHRPGIKNSLINFLLLRSESQRLPERMYEAMEAQAANALTATHAEVAVDRTPVIRLLMAMVAVTFFIALYAVLSPKNPFTSFRRVVSPWSDVAPPTRVAVRDVQPGDGRGFHDQHVAVSAQIDGLRTGEPVVVRYSTVDGQVLARSVPMRVPESSYRYSVELPPDNLGLQQDVEYWIEAGDAITPHYRIKVETSPTIVVEQIEYVYPKYSELPPRKVARHGDIQALAGTQVTLRAKANQLIREASVDFECDGRNDLDLRIDGTKAEVSFPLVWNEKARRSEHESYQLRFRNAEGHENPKPIRYSIDVIRDLPPEIELVEPELDPSKDLLVPPGKPVTFAVQAADPDFKLAAVKFLARRNGMALVDESLLAEPRGGQFQRAYVLDLKRLEVKPGEQIEFWAAADDNREPSANHSETPHYRLRVAAADKNDQNPQNQDQANRDDQRQPKQGKGQKNESGSRRNDNQQQGEQSGEPGDQQSQEKKQSGGKQNQKQQQRDDQSGDKGPQGGGKQQGSDKSPSAGDSDQESDKQSGEGEGSGESDNKGSDKQSGRQDSGGKSDGPKRLDPQRDAGKAIDEINKHFDQKEKQQNGEQNEQSQPQKSGEGAKEQQPNKSGGEEGAEPKEGDAEQQPGEKQAGKKQPSGQPQPGEKQGDEKQSRDQQEQHGDQGHGAQKPDEQSADGEKGESEQTGEKQQAGQKPASQQHKRDKKDQQGDQGALADKKNDKKPGAGEQGSAGGEGEEGEGEKGGQKKQAAKNGKKPSAGDKQAEGAEQGVANEGGDKSEKDKSGGGKSGDAKVGDEQEKHADGETKPRDGQGGQAKGAGERDDKMKKHKGESPDQKGGDQDSKDKGQGGAGDSEGANKHGAPAPHSQNQQRDKKQISPDSKKGTSEDEPESASDSKRQSDSQSGQQGDRDGGGKSGGGQKSNSEGTGSAGQNSEADQGGGQSETKGKGASGEKGGDQQKAEKPTGGKSSGEKGPGTNQGKGEKSDAGQPSDSPEAADPRGHNNVSREPKANRDEQQPTGEKRPQKQPGGEKKQSEPAPKSDARNEGPQGQPTPGERGGHDLRGGKQRSNPTGGGQPGADETTPADEVDNSEPGGEDPNEAYARKATDLALDRLKDQLAKDKPDPKLLEKLKWTREDIERFVQQWDRLKKAADESGPKGEAARQELDDALRSLGLSPHSSSLSGGQKRDERVRNLEGRRTAPPPEYQEQWIEFNKATSRSRKR